MTAELPTRCDVGTKKNSKGFKESWTGYKAHIDVACGQVSVSLLLTSASLHDSQAAIPLMTMTSGRIDYLYEVMDAAYDAEILHRHSQTLGHVAVIDPNYRADQARKDPGPPEPPILHDEPTKSAEPAILKEPLIERRANRYARRRFMLGSFRSFFHDLSD